MLRPSEAPHQPSTCNRAEAVYQTLNPKTLNPSEVPRQPSICTRTEAVHWTLNPKTQNPSQAPRHPSICNKAEALYCTLQSINQASAAKHIHNTIHCKACSVQEVAKALARHLSDTAVCREDLHAQLTHAETHCSKGVTQQISPTPEASALRQETRKN